MATDQRRERHRRRLLTGMSTAVARRGYAAVTVADVVAEAGVSKRTFYEHFPSKQACLLACYVEATALLAGAIRSQIARTTRAGGSSADAVDAVLDTYLSFLDRSPEMTATLLLEVQRAGAEGRRVFRRNNQQFAELIRRTVWAGFDDDLSTALLGGISALVLAHAEDSPDVPFRTIAPAVRRFVRAVMAGDPISS